MINGITVGCDQCGQEYTMNQNMELPPYWLGLLLTIGNKDGDTNGVEYFIHMCSPKCLSEFASGSDITEWVMTVDKEPPEEDGNGGHHAYE